MILDTMYGPRPNGLCGNDDAGQMSAWYIFSSLGFYPVTPGSKVYAIGSPLVKEAIIKLSNNKSLTIKTINQSEKNIFVKSISVNGEKINSNFLSHEQIMNGKKIVFEMSSKHVNL